MHESGHHEWARLVFIVPRLEFEWGNASDRFEQAAVIEPVDPFECGARDGFDAAPRTLAPADFGLVDASFGSFARRSQNSHVSSPVNPTA